MSTTASAAQAARASGRRRVRERLGIGVIGFGWLGHAHSRSMLRIPTLFTDRIYDPVLVACSDPVPERVAEATASFGFHRASMPYSSAALSIPHFFT